MKKTWHVLVEMGVRRVVACKLFWNSGNRVIWNQLEIFNTKIVDGCDSVCGMLRWLVVFQVWACVDFVYSSMALVIWVTFCIHWGFLQMKLHKSKWEMPIMLKLFLKILIISELICVFKRSIIAEMTITVAIIKYMYIHIYGYIYIRVYKGWCGPTAAILLTWVTMGLFSLTVIYLSHFHCLSLDFSFTLLFPCFSLFLKSTL